jgi:hypothetical protein
MWLCHSSLRGRGEIVATNVCQNFVPLFVSGCFGALRKSAVPAQMPEQKHETHTPFVYDDADSILVKRPDLDAKQLSATNVQ